MALFDSALVVAANAVDAAITHFQLHEGAPGAGGTSNVVGSRVAVNGTVDSDGDISWTAEFTGLDADQPVTHVTYWTASTSGTCHGATEITGGDGAANAAGVYTVNITETQSGS